METINGSKYYYKNGEFHRDGDLPAIEWADGSKSHFKNGELHRDGDLPAVEESGGTKYYYKNGKRHRDGDLPAIEWADGRKSYYKNGIEYTKKQVEFMTKMEKKRIMKIFRYWYDKTYSDPNSEAFIDMMTRDMLALERDIGHTLG